MRDRALASRPRRLVRAEIRPANVVYRPTGARAIAQHAFAAQDGGELTQSLLAQCGLEEGLALASRKS